MYTIQYTKGGKKSKTKNTENFDLLRIVFPLQDIAYMSR